MSIFGKIKDAIFRNKAEAAPAAKPASTRPAAPSAQAPAQNTPSQPASKPAAAPAASAPVDVEAVLQGLAAKNPQKLNWRTSIVDLMKLIGLDPTLENRKELARELGYSGDTNDSATMNVWLHKQVMKQLAEHGGKVPAELRD
jgi:hypothetical protein